METKHTKGPWSIINGWDKDGNGKYFPSVLLHGSEKDHENTLGRNSITINVSHDQEVESLMANARLIAAAPELYDFCVKVFELSSQITMPTEADINELNLLSNELIGKVLK